jgi:hypothetical protein
MRAAGVRYQASRKGRHNHADRQRRYRAKLTKVTHQGSPPEGSAALLQTSPMTSVKRSISLWHCDFCSKPQSSLVRNDFLRRRIRRPISFRTREPLHDPDP